MRLLFPLFWHFILADFGSQDEMDLFDLVEEVNANFYEYLGVQSDATKKEINKQYRTLAKTWHPDRNNSENASDNFRILAAVTEILKDEDLRERYDRVLVEGLPNWRSPTYYMRKLRKMSSTEVFILVLVIATTIHYCTMWGSYLEKKMILDDHIDMASKRKKNAAAAEHLKHLKTTVATPSLSNLLPFLIVRGLYYFLCAIPKAYSNYKAEKAAEEAAIKAEADAQEKDRLEREEDKKQREERKREKQAKEAERKKREMEKRAEQLKEIQRLHEEQRIREEEEEKLRELEEDYEDDDEFYSKKKKKKNQKNTNEWTEEDYNILVKLLNKYPGGASNRWDRIAQDMDRNVPDVIKKTKEYQKKIHTAAAGGGPGMYSSSTVKTKKTVVVQPVGGISESFEPAEQETVEVDEWSQNQQKLLEIGLKKFGKDETDRWDKIASDVTGKDKKQCMERYKFLVKQIKEAKM